MPAGQRLFIGELGKLEDGSGRAVMIRGWIVRLRELRQTTFVLVRDCTGIVQCVGATAVLKVQGLKGEDAVEIDGALRRDPRAPGGFELEIREVTVLNAAKAMLPFQSAADLSGISMEILLDHRALSLRNQRIGDIFRIQAAILRYFREFLTTHHFTEIVSSKIVSGGTEGGTNLFAIRYFDRVAYLAQSPQFYKEHGVAGLERVFETGHVYRAEPHATRWHLTEYYSLDLEMGFIDGPEDVIQLERELLTFIFQRLHEEHGAVLARFRSRPLPSFRSAPVWDFEECLQRLRERFSRSDLVDDLDREAERQLCSLAEEACGVPAVFVFGYPLARRPFYTHPRSERTAAGFDLLFDGVEITTGGQRLHRRQDLENALEARGISSDAFASHLRMFELGMPPHGGLAIGLERLTAQILELANVREATLYPRDRYRLTP